MFIVIQQMSWVGVAQVAAGITSLLSLIGFIYFVILRITHQNSSLKFSPELIKALKKTNLTPQQLRSMDAATARMMIEKEAKLSSEILRTGITKELSDKARYTVIISIALLLSALFFGIVWLQNQKGSGVSNLYSGIARNKTSREGVDRVKVKIQSVLTADSTYTDTRGLFSFKVPTNDATFEFSHRDFETVTIHKIFLSETSADTIDLQPKDKIIRVRLYGEIVNTSGKKLSGVRLSSPMAAQTASSDAEGRFEIYLEYERTLKPTLMAELTGYNVWDYPINDVSKGIEIVLTDK